MARRTSGSYVEHVGVQKGGGEGGEEEGRVHEVGVGGPRAPGVYQLLPPVDPQRGRSYI